MPRLTYRRNVKLYTDLPSASITESTVDVHKTYLDTIGRTAVTFKARNLVDDLRDREITISYDYSVASALRKPLVVFSSMLVVFTAAWAVGSLDFGFSRSK